MPLSGNSAAIFSMYSFAVFRILGAEFRVQDSGFRVHGLGLRF
jgi:hypothetical protein